MNRGLDNMKYSAERNSPANDMKQLSYHQSDKIYSHRQNLGTGQNLSGTRAGTIDRGAKTFFRKKIGGRRLFFEKN